MNKRITKRILWRLVNKKINRSSHRYHVFAVMSLLFNEMIKDFEDGKIFKMCNFGKIYLPKSTKKGHYNCVRKKVTASFYRRKMVFLLNPYIKYYLNKSLDFEKTFGVKKEITKTTYQNSKKYQSSKKNEEK